MADFTAKGSRITILLALVKFNVFGNTNALDDVVDHRNFKFKNQSRHVSLFLATLSTLIIILVAFLGVSIFKN